jgi:hypothetical protein
LLVCSVTIILLLSFFFFADWHTGHFFLEMILGIIVCVVLVNCNSLCLRTYLAGFFLLVLPLPCLLYCADFYLYTGQQAI